MIVLQGPHSAGSWPRVPILVFPGYLCPREDSVPFPSAFLLPQTPILVSTPLGLSKGEAYAPFMGNVWA